MCIIYPRGIYFTSKVVWDFENTLLHGQRICSATHKSKCEEDTYITRTWYKKREPPINKKKQPYSVFEISPVSLIWMPPFSRNTIHNMSRSCNRTNTKDTRNIQRTWLEKKRFIKLRKGDSCGVWSHFGLYSLAQKKNVMWSPGLTLSPVSLSFCLSEFSSLGMPP